jgi:hypothetical protein
MVTITCAAPETEEREDLVFRVRERAVLFAGSRNGSVDPELAERLVSGLALSEFSFLVGCATGIDACFRLTLAEREAWRESTFVACAFADRVRSSESRGLFASVVVPDGLSRAAALRRRTLWMVKRAEFIVLFPDDPLTGRWGRGSRLAFRAATEQLKPAFVVSSTAPPRSPVYRVIPSRLFDAVDGYWAVPHPTADGTCDGEV